MDSTHTTDSNPLKRRQTANDSNNESTPNHPNFEKDPSLWEDDGNIILVCQAGPSPTGYRLYRGILSKRCEVFRDMFTTCDAPDTSQASAETFEGCPVVTVHDRPADLSCFLRYILDRDFAVDIKSLQLSELSSLLRMSTKYIYPSLRSKIINHLTTLYPSELEDFRSNQRKALLPKDFNGITGLQLGLECDVPAILPVAYYLCSNLSPAEWFDGIPNDSSGGAPIILSPTELRLVIEFKHRFSRTMITQTYLADVGMFDCPKVSCRLNFPRTLSEQDFKFFDSDVGRLECGIFDEASAIIGPQSRSKLCGGCYNMLWPRERQMQATAWYTLPSMCQLGSWESLKGSRTS